MMSLDWVMISFQSTKPQLPDWFNCKKQPFLDQRVKTFESLFPDFRCGQGDKYSLLIHSSSGPS